MAWQDFAVQYEKSPIIFNGGMATNLAGGQLPIISLTQSQDFEGGVLSSANGLNWEDYLFSFYPLAGSTLNEFQIGHYPFANQTVAANAIIAEPLRISLLMLAPVNGNNGGYATKTSVFSALKAAIDLHCSLGGTFNIATPAYIYQDCLLLTLRDVSESSSGQPQTRWQWDFEQPLVTLSAAEGAQNAFMARVTSQTQLTPDDSGVVTTSGLQTTVGNPSSLAGTSVVPAQSSLPGATTGGAQGGS